MKKLIALLVALMMLGTAAAAMADVVTVAFNPEYPPFESVNGDVYEGYDVDLIKAVAEKAGFDIEFEAMDFDAVIAAVQANPNTIGVSGISITDERKLSVDFSEGYINAGLIVVVKKDSGYATTDDLKGKVIGVQMGTTSDFAAEEITGQENTAKYKSFLNAIMELQGNKVDAVIVDKPVGMAILASLANLLLLTLIVKKFLFKPVKKVLQSRRAAIDEDYDRAKTAREQAEESREHYEAAMAAAHQTADQMISEAARTAEHRSNEIVSDARRKATEIRRQAEADAVLERKKAEAEMKHEIANVSAQLTGKLLQREINEEDHRELIDSFLNELD